MEMKALKKEYCTIKNSKLIWQIEKISNNKAYLSMNNKKLITSVDSISIIDNYIPESTNTVHITTTVDKNIPSEIMLRHLTKLEALEQLDRFIDRAIAGGLVRVKIIHGRHGGIIRNAVHEYLDNCPYISSYNFGDYHEGGFGVTIAYIKRYN